MRVWYFSEMAYHPAWEEGLKRGSLRWPAELPAVGQRVEPPVGLGFIGDSQRQRYSRETRLALASAVGAITVVSPMRRLACMILFSEPGGTIPGGGGSGLSLKRISIVVSAPSALR